MPNDAQLPVIVDTILGFLVMGSLTVGIQVFVSTKELPGAGRTRTWLILQIALAALFIFGLCIHHWAPVGGLAQEIFSPLRVAVVPLATLIAGYYMASVKLNPQPAPVFSDAVMRKLQAVWRSFVVALPFWLIVISIGLLIWGYQLEPSQEKHQKILYTIGSAALSSGVFAAMLKAMQFMGIFQDAIERIVLHKQDWLASLSESKLRILFKDVVSSIVAKGFPALSERLSNDVIDHILPKLGDYYYSKMHRRLALVDFDPATGMLQMEEEYELIINSHSPQTVVPYDFQLEGNWPAIMKSCPYVVTSLVINEENRTKVVRIVGRKGKGLTVKYSIKLTGDQCYNVRRNMKRSTHVPSDPVFHMIATRFTESMIVSVDNRVSDYIAVKPIAIGINEKGITISTQERHLLRCEVKQLMLPGDGLLLVFEKV